MKESNLHKCLVAAIGAVVLCLPTVLLADVSNFSEDPAHTHVTYVERDLYSDEGMQQLHERLRVATRKVCGITSPMSAGTAAWHACNRNTFATVVDNFNNAHIDCMHEKLVEETT